MENIHLDNTSIDWLIAQRLKSLRAERGWSLDELVRRSNVSRATLSRLENAEVSPTTSMLGKLCAAYGLTIRKEHYKTMHALPLPSIERISPEEEPVVLPQLIHLLQDTVASGASVGFLPPLNAEDAQQYWRMVFQEVTQSTCVLLVARDA